MNSSTQIIRMYQITEELMGKIEAKKSVSTMISLVINDLQEEGKEINEENLNTRLEIYVKDFYDVYKAKQSA